AQLVEHGLGTPEAPVAEGCRAECCAFRRRRARRVGRFVGFRHGHASGNSKQCKRKNDSIATQVHTTDYTHFAASCTRRPPPAPRARACTATTASGANAAATFSARAKSAGPIPLDGLNFS